jgi:nucleotide-binding universal stress UspA family protein
MKWTQVADQILLEYRNAQNRKPPGSPTLRIRHILAPTDFSKESRRAVNHAMNLAKRYQARLTLLCIFKTQETPRYGPEITELEQQRQNSDSAKLRLLKLYDVIRAQYPNTEIIFRVGDPQSDIPNIAAALQVDLVVI